MHPACCGHDPVCTDTFKACMLVAWADCVNPSGGWTDPTLQVRMCNPKGYTPSNAVASCGAGPTPCFKPSAAPQTTQRTPVYQAPTDAPTQGGQYPRAQPPGYARPPRQPRSYGDRQRIQAAWDQRRVRRSRYQPSDQSQSSQSSGQYRPAQQPAEYPRAQPQLVDVGEPRYRA